MKRFIVLPICVLINALFIVMLFSTSCSKNEPDLPVITYSEVVDQGIDARVTAKSLPGGSGTGSAGTEVSYNSWIKVMAETAGGKSSAPANAPKRASSNGNAETIWVSLRDVFHNLDTTIIVDSFVFGEPTADITYTTNGSRRQGYVTITDSVMHYNVNFDGFSFRYMIEYEVAVYADGYTRVVMPYHKIKNIRDNGYSIEDMSFVIEPDDSGSLEVYLRKKIKHSITVELNGEDYKLTGNVILKWHIGTHPCIVSQELIDKGISDINNQNRFTVYTSWAKVKYTYSDNRTETQTFSYTFRGELQYNYEAAGTTLYSLDNSFISAVVHNTDKVLGVRTEQSIGESLIEVTNQEKQLVVTYSQFSFSCKLYEYHGKYTSRFLEFDFPELNYTGETKEESNFKFNSEDQSNSIYWFNFRISAKFGDAWHSFAESLYTIINK